MKPLRNFDHALHVLLWGLRHLSGQFFEVIYPAPQELNICLFYNSGGWPRDPR